MPDIQLTEDQLKAVIKFQLSNFSLHSTDITDETRLDAILSPDGVNGDSSLSSENIFKLFIGYTMNSKDIVWPENWTELTVAELAGKLMVSTSGNP